MTPTCLREASDEDVISAVQEQYLVGYFQFLQRVERGEYVGEDLSAAGVHGHCYPLALLKGQVVKVSQLRQERRWQVADAEEPQVLEGVHRLGFAGTGHARDYQKGSWPAHAGTASGLASLPSSMPLL